MINNNSISTFLNLSEFFLPKIVPLATIVISAKSKKNSIAVGSQAKEAKAVHKVAKTNVKARVVSKSRIRKDEKRRNDIISRVIQLEKDLGGCAPGLLDLSLRFSREEIDAVWDDLMWLYPDFDKKGSVPYEAEVVA